MALVITDQIYFTKGQLCGALMFSLLFAWITCWTNIQVAGDFMTLIWGHDNEFMRQTTISQKYDIHMAQGIPKILVLIKNLLL